MGFYTSLILTFAQTVLLLGELASWWDLKWYWGLSPMIAMFLIPFLIAFAHGFTLGYKQTRKQQMTNALLIFASTFVLVFALGFQSLNVNSGKYAAAFLTSFFIAGSNLVLFKTVPQSGGLEIFAYLLAGPFAIVASMYVHKRWMKK
jgi:hypothetical protein